MKIQNIDDGNINKSLHQNQKQLVASLESSCNLILIPDLVLSYNVVLSKGNWSFENMIFCVEIVCVLVQTFNFIFICPVN